MATHGKVEDIVAEIMKPIEEETGIELVDVEYRKESGGWVVRVIIDKIGGITHDDCAIVSDKVGEGLDAGDPIPHQYRLEVSSPGIDRPLKTEKDFERFKGEMVEAKLFAPYKGKKKIVGRLSGYDEESIDIITEEEEHISLLREKISTLKLHIRF